VKKNLLTAALLIAALACSRSAHRTFASPEDAVKALADAVKAGQLDEVVAIFGPEGKELIDSSDPATAKQNREVFSAAVRERWKLVEERPESRTLVIGNEEWPFPVPLVKDGNRWRFDTAAGKEEVIARRIGRNELAAIRVCRTYVAAQRLYASQGRDGRRAGMYAATFRSDPGKHNGLYWPHAAGERRSPLGDLLAEAADDGRADAKQRQPFHGYYFRILTGQGAAAAGGEKNYIVNGEMSGGFALVAWPAEYDVTGVMTFVVNQDGVVRETDLGRGTDGAAKAMTLYNPGETWSIAQ
jgi:hypothetical protein